MNLLLDENLSPRLVGRLASLFSGLKHVSEVELRQADDRVIWDWAQANEHTIVTTDFDFVVMSQRLGWPPKIIHIEKCDVPFRVIESLLRASAVLIAEFYKNESAGVLTLRIPSQVVRPSI